MPDQFLPDHHDDKRPILLAAGGTGGHLFPAEALAEVLIQRGHRVALVTDKRVAGSDWASRFPGDVHMLTAGTVTGASLMAKVQGGFRLLMGLKQAWSLLGEINPRAVIGFGGYPTVPPVMAATFRKIPTIIHEANAVMGRANRFLAPRVTSIATGFPLSEPEFADKTVFTGNPVRRPVLLAASKDYDRPQPGGQLRLLVFGGSQGARVMSDVVPGALQHVPEALRARLHITQQARDEDINRVSKMYAALGIAHEVQSFYDDLPHRIAAAHLVIARAGAMTVSELAVIGRPGILVPLPGALDHDQAENAAIIAEAGGAIPIAQEVFTPVSLAELLERLANQPERLERMAHDAKKVGISDASARLASHVLSILAPA